MENKLAPIVLFVYNRPWHTLQTLESLKNNELSNESELFIYADGPKYNASVEDLEKIKETREIVRKNNWCGKVHIIESSYNRGLANSVINGVTEVINKYGKIIVLEDDLVTSKGFLRYMNDALNFYKNERRVMHISGYMFPLKCNLPETFFYNSTSCWGWGTWKDSWDLINLNSKDLLEKIHQKGNLDDFDFKKTFGFIQQLEHNVNGKLETWAIKWHSSVYLADGFSLHPNCSLVNNIGHDLTGANCVKTTRYDWDKLADEIKVKSIPIEESLIVRKGMIEFNSISGIDKKPLLKKIYTKIRKLITRFNILIH